MKWIIGIPTACGIAGLISGVVGIQQVSYSISSGLVVVHHTVAGRLPAIVLAAALLVAAYGCKKRKKYGWYVVAALLAAMLLGEVYVAVLATFASELPLAAKALGMLGEAAMIAFLSWLLLRFWARQRKYFENA